MQYSQCDTGPATGFIPELWVNSLVSEDKCFPVQEISPANARITTATRVDDISLPVYLNLIINIILIIIDISCISCI